MRQPNTASLSNLDLMEDSSLPKVSFRGISVRPCAEIHQQLQQELGVSYILSVILANRGIQSTEEAKVFLRPTLREGLPSPLLIKNISQAVDLILEYVFSKKKITIFTDFDVDGLTSGAQLVLFLKAMGANCDAYTPNRFTEGYGLSCEAINKLAITGTKILITVDCGISNNKEIAHAKSLGMRCIIIDHHQVPKTAPAADVIVDPAQDGCEFQEYRLSAAGLVWMLLIALKKQVDVRGGLEDIQVPDPKDFLDLAAIGTICDMVPLNKVNRIIASRGLEVVHKTTRPGLIALKENAGIRSYRPISGSSVAFALGPRINAAGRLNDASEVFELLTTGNIERARLIASKVEKLNTKRKALEATIRDVCVQQICADYGESLPFGFALYGEDFHIGVIGIVAQRIVEMFHRPAAVMGPSEVRIGGKVKTIVKGSVRGIQGFNVADVLETVKPVLISGGGHAAAGGFSLELENVPKFQQAFIDAAEATLRAKDLTKNYIVDLEVQLEELSFSLAEELQQLAPFGIGNPTPLFLLRNVEIDSVAPLARNHARTRIKSKQMAVNAVAWGFLGHPLLQKGQIADVVCSADINTYNGLSSLQLEIKEILPTS